MDYRIYRIESWRTREQAWMEEHGYTDPHGPYIVYKLEKEELFDKVDVNALIEKATAKEVRHREETNQEVNAEWLASIHGAPLFLTGEEIAE